jgi:hypothetical protein
VTHVGKGMQAVGHEVGSELRDCFGVAHRVMSDRVGPLEKLDGIAAALSDSVRQMGRRAQARVGVNSGMLEHTMWPRRGFGLWRNGFGALWPVAAEGVARVRADAEVELVGVSATAHVDRGRAKLRHVHSILVESCSTLLTKIGPAIICSQADEQATAPEDVLRRRVRKRRDKSWRERAQQPVVPLRAKADADEAGSWAGSQCGRWQGHLYSPPFRRRDGSDGPRLDVRAQREEIGECGGLFEVAMAFFRGITYFTNPPFFLAKLHPDGESYGRVPPNMPHPPLPPNPPTGRPNAPARTTFPLVRPRLLLQ